jgi:hypothetical protein
LSVLAGAGCHVLVIQRTHTTKITRGNYNRRKESLTTTTCTPEDGQLGWNM